MKKAVPGIIVVVFIFLAILSTMPSPYLEEGPSWIGGLIPLTFVIGFFYAFGKINTFIWGFHKKAKRGWK